MFLETALALACITSTGVIDVPPCSLSSLQAVALSMELMDRCEAKYMFASGLEFKRDIATMRRRYEELRYAPPARDAERFPTREVAREWKAFNEQYVAFLTGRKLLFKDAWIDEAITEAERIQRVLDFVIDARCDYYYITVRRKALADLRQEIGLAAYYAGTLPATVPVWYFWRID